MLFLIIKSLYAITGLCLFFEKPNKPSSVEPVSEAGLSPVRYTSSRRKVHRSSVSRVRRNTIPQTATCPTTAASAVRSRPTEEDTIQALMDLALPRFGSFDGRAAPTWKPWPVSLSSPASPPPPPPPPGWSYGPG